MTRHLSQLIQHLLCSCLFGAAARAAVGCTLHDQTACRHCYGQ
jgi:hypothetical protein